MQEYLCTCEYKQAEVWLEKAQKTLVALLSRKIDKPGDYYGDAPKFWLW